MWHALVFKLYKRHVTTMANKQCNVTVKKCVILITISKCIDTRLFYIYSISNVKQQDQKWIVRRSNDIHLNWRSYILLRTPENKKIIIIIHYNVIFRIKYNIVTHYFYTVTKIISILLLKITIKVCHLIM